MEMPSFNWAGIFGVLCLAIIFLQSGLDKVFNYKRELGWIQQKFTRSALYNYISTLFFLLTVFEVVSGVLSGAGAMLMLAGESAQVAKWGAWLSVLTLLMLIFGQRITRDYTGSASLLPYFIAGVLTLFFLNQ